MEWCHHGLCRVLRVFEVDLSNKPTHQVISNLPRPGETEEFIALRPEARQSQISLDLVGLANHRPLFSSLRLALQLGLLDSDRRSRVAIAVPLSPAFATEQFETYPSRGAT